MELIRAYYPWVKAVHIIGMVAWMAGLLYLPRLFVYHSTVPADSEASALFKVMERRLLRGIMLPAMIITVIFGGLLLAASPGYFHQGWIHAKLLLVLVLLGFHHLLGSWRRAFAEDRNTKSAKFFRRINEIPTLALILIVILVVIRPF